MNETLTPQPSAPTTDAPQEASQQEPARAKPPLMRRWSDGLAPAHAQDPNAPWTMSEQWPVLVATLSEQAVDSSNLVLRALDFLVGAGRMRRAEAKALTDALYRLRDTSLRAQQITRLASGRIRQAKDRVALSEVVQGLLDERRDDFQAVRATVSADLAPVDVLLDPPVTVSLVNTLLDWALTFSREIVLRVEAAVWPGPAKLVALVTTPPPGEARERGRRLNDGLQWMLLRQMVASAELSIHRGGGNGQAVVTIEFPKTFISGEGMSSVELLDTAGGAGAALSGWVLVLARRDMLQAAAVQVLENAGIEARGTTSLARAREIVAERRPSAVVAAWDCLGEDFDAFRAECLGPENRCPLVEITERSPSFNTLALSAAEVAKVGQEAIRKELAPTVLFELAKLA
ncbi:MAG TPA: hypothetical protein VEA40_25770 [Ramlibacter sp.]|nr:hypothetical protein [Ramlibacter sp.]